MPDWNTLVKPFYEQSLYWHKLWKDSGCPHSGYVSEMIIKSRAQYHQAYKQAARNAKNNSRKKMAETVLNDNSRQFWTEVRKIKHQSTQLPTSMDGAMSNDAISSLLKAKYEELYNRLSYDDKDMEKLHQELRKAKSTCMDGTCTGIIQ